MVNVINAYRRHREEDGVDADRDSLTDLAATISAAGGAEGFAALVNNRQRTSTRNGVLKAAAVATACSALTDTAVTTTADIRDVSRERLTDDERAWRALPGQRSGVSWHYLLLLTGREDVKPDRMIVRFVTIAIGRRPSPAEAADLVRAAAPRLRVDVRTLDHRIWDYQRDSNAARSRSLSDQ